jgi:hypothetical protein
MAFSVPLILTATGGAHRSRQEMEADTRSAWIASDVKRRIIHGWTDFGSYRHRETELVFPSTEIPKSTMEWLYDRQGLLIAENIEKAAYLVSVEATPYFTAQYHSDFSPLARVKINIRYPAEAPANRQKKLTYQFVSNRYGS